MRSVGLHAVLVFMALAAGTVLVAPNADAGIRESLANVRDAIGCTTKAVLNPMRVLKWGMKNFERLSGQEYERKADQSIGEALEECREAAENIFARAFGVDDVVESVRDHSQRAQDIVNSAQRARDRVSDWFKGDAGTPADRRVALSVTARERDFYEKETDVLDDQPLPAASGWETRDEPAPDGQRTQHRETDSTGTADPWSNDEGTVPSPSTSAVDSTGEAAAPGETDLWSDDDGTAPSPDTSAVDSTGEADPWGDAGTRAEDDSWSQADTDGSAPWRRDDADGNPPTEASDAEYDSEIPEDGGEDSSYAAALTRAFGGSAPGTSAAGACPGCGVALDDTADGSAQGLVPESDYDRALAALDRNEAAERDAAEAERQRAERKAAAEPQRAEIETEPVTRPGSAGGIDSSDCQDMTPTCHQVMATIGERTAAAEARLATGGLSMSATYDLAAEMYKGVLDLLPTCHATETRPHCRAAIQRILEEVRRAYESAREGARQARGG